MTKQPDSPPKPIPLLWGERKLIQDYNGPLLRLGRIGDNSEMDFYADQTGQVCETAMSEFAPPSDRFVVKYYYQVADKTGRGDLAAPAFVRKKAGA